VQLALTPRPRIFSGAFVARRLLNPAAPMRRSAKILSGVFLAALGACGSDDRDTDAARYATVDSQLCLSNACSGGTSCCTGSAYSNIPADHKYYLTTFGGGSDTGTMSCGGTADGTWWYAADRQRFGCHSVIKIT